MLLKNNLNISTDYLVYTSLKKATHFTPPSFLIHPSDFIIHSTIQRMTKDVE